jgi:hypothetical protein
MRLTNKTVEEYQRLSKNAKAKIRRIQKNYGDEVVIVGNNGEPKIVKTEQLFKLPSIEDFQNRKAFNEWVENQKHFIKNGNYRFSKNDYGAVGSKNLIHKIQRDVELSQRLAKKKIAEQEEKPIYNAKGEQVATVGQRLEMMKEPITGISVPADFNFSKVRGNRQLANKGINVKKRISPKYYDERQKRMMDNYIGLVKDSFNSEADDYIKELEKLPPDVFYDMYLTYFEDMNFDVFYTSEGVEAGDGGKNGQLQGLESVLERYKRGEFYSLKDTDF